MFGEKLRKLRTDNHLTQDELAEKSVGRNELLKRRMAAQLSAVPPHYINTSLSHLG